MEINVGVEMLKADWRELGRLVRSCGMVWVRSDEELL